MKYQLLVQDSEGILRVQGVACDRESAIAAFSFTKHEHVVLEPMPEPNLPPMMLVGKAHDYNPNKAVLHD